MVLKTAKDRGRTKKEFTDYNDYRDRSFGLKWNTAFAIDELNKVIVDNKETSLKVTQELPKMSRMEIDEVLQYAFLKTKKVSIQLNMKDENDNYLDNIIGSFNGYADTQYLYLSNYRVQWDFIRNIAIIED